MKQQTYIIPIINQKGGVGKTTTVINLSAYLVKYNFKVLIVDLDPQGNCTTGLGIDKNSLTMSIKDVILGNVRSDDVIISTSAMIDVIATNQSLATLELDIANTVDRESMLKQSLMDLDYDFIIIDCPPSLSLLTINALVAATHVIIPVQAEYYALEGLGQLLEVVQLVKTNLNPALEMLGVLVTMFDNRISLSGQVRGELLDYFGEKVFKTTIPRNVRLAEAPSYGSTIVSYDKWSRGAKAYKQFTKELISRLNLPS